VETSFKISWIIFALTLAVTLVAFHVLPGKGPLVILVVPVSMLIGLGAAHASRRANPNMRVTQFRNVVLAGSTITKAFAISLIIWAALHPALRPLLPKVIFAVGGLLVILAGNYLPKTARNDARNLPRPWNYLFSIPWALPLSYLFGVRTWWTLSSDLVWNRTQRFAGRLWMLGGFGYVLAPWLFTGATAVRFILADLGIMVLLPILYSWWVSPSEQTVPVIFGAHAKE
jgi:uncharacterized membrane protein